MAWLNNRTEMSYRAVYGHIQTVVEANVCNGDFAGIADLNGTWGHVKWSNACKAAGVKPIFGVRLAVANLPERVRRYRYNVMTFIARNNAGLEELYQLVDFAHQQFYYRPRITYDQLNTTSQNIAVLSGVSPEIERITREIFYELSPAMPLCRRKEPSRFSPIACIDNWYPYKGDRAIYEPMADERQTEKKTTPQYILKYKEWLKIFPGREDAIENMINLADQCTATLPTASMVEYPDKADIDKLCQAGAQEKGIDLENQEYIDRYNREMALITQKGYVDYFLVVADLIKYAKKKMLVGPGRGSSGGSLVCYLLDITDIDPIKYGLLFERFIDPNRFDLPDIDIDFADDKRNLAIKYLQSKYGAFCVAQLGNISRLGPKSALNKVAKNLRIPLEEVTEVKEALIERPAGDSRFDFCLFDTLTTTDAGKHFLDHHPAMATAAEIENHASHSSVHAAGVLVCNEAITKYCGINSRDRKRIAMIDKKDAEKLNLLKIDVLGLRTLSILADTCKQIKKPVKWLYSIPVDDKKAYEVFADNRLTGIFQFEGETLRRLSKKATITDIDDICALTSVARPGPLQAGVAEKYVKATRKKQKSMIIYQEQIMEICREYAGLPWETIGKIRKALSKSMGAEYMRQYKDAFFAGARKNGHKDIEDQWRNIEESGSYLFNKSHALAYSIISYWCAYLKAHYPLEFAVSTLNHAKDNNSAIKMLRELREQEKIDYVPLDRKHSRPEWTFRNGKLLGGLLTINGIGPAAATKIMKCRNERLPVPAGIAKKLRAMDTPFLSIYPATEIYGDYYAHPEKYLEDIEVSTIDKITIGGEYAFIGRLLRKELKDANSPHYIKKRGGEHLDGPTTFLSVTIEDDTGQINCTIGRDIYQEIGIDIVENGTLDKSWYLIIGKRADEFNHVFISDIMEITK